MFLITLPSVCCTSKSQGSLTFTNSQVHLPPARSKCPPLVQHVFHPHHLDDEIAALSLQLKEVNFREDTKKAKYTSDNVPDLEVAYADYLTEIETHLAFLKDVKLAHSIDNAVDADAQAIAEITQGEAQAQQDHRVAVEMSSEDPELEAPPAYTEEGRDEFSKARLCVAWPHCSLQAVSFTKPQRPKRAHLFPMLNARLMHLEFWLAKRLVVLLVPTNFVWPTLRSSSASISIAAPV